MSDALAEWVQFSLYRHSIFKLSESNRSSTCSSSRASSRGSGRGSNNATMTMTTLQLFADAVPPDLESWRACQTLKLYPDTIAGQIFQGLLNALGAICL